MSEKKGAALYVVLLVLLLSLTCFIPAPIAPQQPAEPPRMLVLGGVCVVSDTTLPWPAISSLYRVTCPVIVFNPLILNEWGGDMAIFVLLHEYAHLTLGHAPDSTTTEAERDRMEQEADCKAAQLFALRWPDNVPILLRRAEELLDIPKVRTIKACAELALRPPQ